MGVRYLVTGGAGFIGSHLAEAKAPGAAGEVINIGCGQATSINRLADLMIQLRGAPCRVQVSPEEGLRSTLAWYAQASP